MSRLVRFKATSDSFTDLFFRLSNSSTIRLDFRMMLSTSVEIESSQLPTFVAAFVIIIYDLYIKSSHSKTRKSGKFTKRLARLESVYHLGLPRVHQKPPTFSSNFFDKSCNVARYREGDVYHDYVEAYGMV